MNIIIVGKAHSAPRNIDLGSPRGRLVAAAVAGAAAATFIAFGFVAALLISGPRDRTVREVHELHDVILQQSRQLDGVKGESQRNLDALALQLGQLQAQATRLNALGERLTQIGKLDDGEFNFTEQPAMGGPEEPSTGAAVPLAQGISSLQAEFARQDAQLGVLENLLLDRKVDNALLPTGMPVAHAYIASGFGERTDPINGRQSIHRGIDFDAPMGSDITAVADGVVTYAGVRSGYGNVVELDHGNGYMTRYAHDSKLLVHVGERVRAGQAIARVGSTGRSTGPHCHFEVWLHGRAVNPIAYVRSKRVNRL
ncbi:MAG TPA: peptidoglycan DD-metalloendopeptidase family protein [Rhodanobacteraceae bacterium]|nr:peptidoglycan DD-metalloendopeptidase family protein [Rhodanobacteraceae bacterium]